jgi:hypothetical protein
MVKVCSIVVIDPLAAFDFLEGVGGPSTEDGPAFVFTQGTSPEGELIGIHTNIQVK